ncbi:MAG: patatin, partial [Proteobacteria bacterium]|nr:patatin [Pseudomonadota bacterium]
YASGMSGFDLQKLALGMEEDMLADWTLPNRGVLKGEALQDFINQQVKNLPMQKLPKPLGVVATDLQSGEKVLFRTGNTGMAVRASSTVPGVFQPVDINGRDFVDGGLTSPVPAQSARSMGADFVIAVDISNGPCHQPA